MNITYISIQSFEFYEVGDDGSVWSTRFGKRRRLKPYPDGRGYLAVILRRGGRSHMFRVHRLVLESFVGPRPDGRECRHLDGDRVNNALTNLTWGTRAENNADKPRRYRTLGWDGAQEARRLHREGMTFLQVAETLDQPIVNVRNAIKYKTYKTTPVASA
jgi:hypothetical protein